MTFTPEAKAALAAKLDADAVKQREQGGRKVHYIEGWHAIAEANRIFGFDGWTRETIRLDETNRELVTLKGNNGEYKQWRVGYLAIVKITVGDVVRVGTGFGNGMGKPEALGDAVESAAKEAETDAMKRALMTFGNPFGLALYDKTQENVEKAEPPPKAPAKAPASKPSPSDFWTRPSYELPGADLLKFAGHMVRACEAAPHPDCLLKLEDHNKDHIAALNNQAPSDWKRVQTALTEARKRLTILAA